MHVRTEKAIQCHLGCCTVQMSTVGGHSSPSCRPWACSYYVTLWCMSSVIPDLWLPSQSQNVTVLWPLANYVVCW